MRHSFLTYILQIQHRRFLKRFKSAYIFEAYICFEEFSFFGFQHKHFNPKRILIPTIYGYEIVLHIAVTLTHTLINVIFRNSDDGLKKCALFIFSSRRIR